MMSPSLTDLTHVLSGVLPDDLHQHIPSLVQQLAAVVAGKEPSAPSDSVAATIRTTLLQALAGKRIAWGTHVLTFEDHPHLGIVQIQDQAQSTVRQCDLLLVASETRTALLRSEGQVSLSNTTVVGPVIGVSHGDVITTITTSWEPPSPPALEPPPRTDHLVERPVEYTMYAQQLTTDHLAAITGMPGVGKTALAAQLARQHAPLEHVFWHTCLSTDGVATVCRQLAIFVAQRGQDAVWRLLHSHSPVPPPTELLGYLLPLLCDQGYLLCLDNLHWLNDDPALSTLLTRLQELCTEQRVRLLLISRHIPSGWNVPIPPLQGLSRDDTATLLQVRHITLAPALLDILQTRTAGNAKLLELAIALMTHQPHPQHVITQLDEQGHIEGYLQQEIYAQLSPEAQQVMQALAVLGEAGGTRAAIEAVLDGRPTRRVLRMLVEQSVVEEHLEIPTRWYRQHTLVQTICYDEIDRHTREAMHYRAGQYYVPQLATAIRGVDQLMQAGTYDAAVEGLTVQLGALINHGEIHGIQRLLEKLERQQVSTASWAAVNTALGEIYSMVGQLDRARERLQMALQHSATSDHDINGSDQVRRYRLLAQVESHTGNYIEAQTACRIGLRVATKEACRPDEHAHLYVQLAEVLLRQSDYDAAEQACQEGLNQLPPEPEIPDIRAALWQRWGVIKGHRGMYDQAIDFLTYSLHSAAQAEQKVLTAAILHNIGAFFYYCGKLDQAHVCYTYSILLKTRIGDLVGQIPTLMNQGLLDTLCGKYEHALQNLEQAYTQAKAYGLTERCATTLVNIGLVHVYQEQLNTARKFLYQAYVLFQDLLDDYGRADCLCRLGDVALLEQAVLQARSYGEQALTVAQHIESTTYIAYALRIVGEACIYQGNLDAAATYLMQAQQVHADLDEPYDYVLLLAAQIRLAVGQEQWKHAQTLLEEGIQVARSGQSIYHIRLIEQLAETVKRQSRQDET